MAAPNKPDENKKQDLQDAEENAGRTEAGQTTISEQKGANQLQEDQTAGKVFGDTTSSMAGKNQSGYHGRDGGIAEGTTNNPAAQEQSEESEAEPEPEPEAPKTL